MMNLWKEPRPCIVKRKGEPAQRAFFHLFTKSAYVIAPALAAGGHPGGQCSEPSAVVEYENGDVDVVPVAAVHFLDTAHQMELYHWEAKP